MNLFTNFSIIVSSYLWQNFLIDTKVKEYIFEQIKKIYQENNLQSIIEIWPWKWAITKKIVGVSDNLFLIEKDPEMVKILSQKIEDQELLLNKENIINIDVLEQDVNIFLKEKNIDPQKTLIVWNLPYYITSPILRKFFWSGEKEYFGWFFMIQHEVGEKIDFNANKKSYLYWLLNYAYRVVYKKTIGPKSFKPAPKVKSCLIELLQSEKPNISFLKLQEFLDLFSPFSRKTLGAIQTMLIKKKKLDNNIVPLEYKNNRLEECTFVDLETMIR